MAKWLLFFFKAKGAEGNKETKTVLPVLVVSYQQQSHHSRSPTHTFDSQLAAQPQKGQKQRGQLVFSQLICQSGPQTSDHITVNLPDKSRRRGGGAARTCSPITLTSPWAKWPGPCEFFAQDPGSPSDGGRVACHSSRADVTWSLRC